MLRSVLKTIRTDQLRLGMFVHQFSGSWISHPFWRSRFLLRDARDLAKIQEMGLSSLVIDTDKGLDVAELPPEPGDAAPPAEVLPAAAIDEPIVLPLPESHPALALAGPAYQDAAALSRKAVRQVIDLYGAARLGRTLDQDACRNVVEDVVVSVARKPHALISIARLKSVSDYTYLHAVAVCALMAGLARQMGWEEADVRQAALAGLLLDVGKATLPDDLVQRAGRLNPEERTLLRTHAQRGHDLLVAEGAMTPGAAGGAAAPRAPQRQRLSPGPAGRGHSADRPHGGAVRRVRRRDLAAPYRAPWDPAEAMRQLARSKGLYDAVVFQHLVKTVGIYPVGALVRLKSEQLAVVLEQHGGSLLTPKVRVFYSVAERHRVEPFVLDLSKPSCADRIADLESPEGWRFADLEAQWLAH
jgi:hypothetical protein